MGSCIDAVKVISKWINSCLGFLKLCFKSKKVEVIISTMSLILGLVGIVSDWMNWIEWRNGCGSLPDVNQQYYGTLLQHIVIFGTTLFCLKIILLCFKLHYARRRNSILPIICKAENEKEENEKK